MHRRLAPLSVNTATLGFKQPLPVVVEALARRSVQGIAPWRREFQDTPVKEARRIIADAGLQVTSLCRGSYLTFASDHQRRAILEDNRRAIDEAAAMGAPTLCMVVGGLPEGVRDLAQARDQVAEQLAALVPHARAHQVRLSVEPLHPMYAADRSCISTLAQALDICDRIGPDLGVMIDAYHLWWDPEFAAGLARAGQDRLLGWQICDWRAVTRDLLQDRGMIGDGVIDLKRMHRDMLEAGWRGMIEVEIFSGLDWDHRPMDETLDVLCARFADLALPAEPVSTF
ncbi:MAG TPA: sugar phosphate isomerase/epimerase family protein [Geminicoccus sp.]|uniref:sugar phosphate isomerase/epimerase family protein n=1 Tax=Geminicoccus sp. TaxID=2024832 RepID=UPI002E364B91|nr:sugar phosphate isomerase/epimerase family protein [Geminicoccus sp.]HEX2527154.1 sugar phosphate isomerase/epimerase family protein [Geminicoccus sp.]